MSSKSHRKCAKKAKRIEVIQQDETRICYLSAAEQLCLPGSTVFNAQRSFCESYFRIMARTILSRHTYPRRNSSDDLKKKRTGVSVSFFTVFPPYYSSSPRTELVSLFM
jgi:hypothetical protein